MIRNAWLSGCSARRAGVSARVPVCVPTAGVPSFPAGVSRVAYPVGVSLRGRRVAFPTAAAHGRAGVSRARSAAGNPQLLAGLHGGAAQGVEVDDLPDDHAGVLIGIRALGH